MLECIKKCNTLSEAKRELIAVSQSCDEIPLIPFTWRANKSSSFETVYAPSFHFSTMATIIKPNQDITSDDICREPRFEIFEFILATKERECKSSSSSLVS